MKTYATILFVCLSMNVFSQVNFFQTGATWGYSSLEHPDTPWDPYRIWLDQYSITGDTNLNGLAYKKLHDHVKETDMTGSGSVANIVYYDYYYQYLRYDSINNKIFCYSDLNSSESLIFDFNLSVGDTVPNIHDFIIDSIENISFFGSNVKKYYYSNDTSVNAFNSTQYIIEGMGGSNGLTVLQPNRILVSAHTVTDLVCFQLAGSVYPSGSICDVFAGIGEIERNNSLVSVYPNPFRNKFQVNFSPEYKNVTFKINDIVGKNIYSKVIQNSTEINDFQKPGMFFWQAFSDENLIGNGKIINE